MGLLDTIRATLGFEHRGANPENPSTPLSAIAKWISAGNETVSGELINENSALQVTTVYACVRVLSESVASLPCLVYERVQGGRQEATANPLYYLLGAEPNPEMSAVTFWEAIVGASALTGNAYAEVVRNNAGQVVELYPLHPLMTEPFRQPDGSLAYRTRQGMANGQWRTLASTACLHFPLWSFDGLKGMSPVTMARQALGLTRAAEKFGAKWFGNGSKPGGILTGPPGLAPEQQVMAKESWQAAHGGSNQGRTAVLPGEWKYEPVGLSPEDSQFLATRQFQRSEVAAMFRVPSHMVGDTSKISNSNYEQMALSFVMDTLRPILSRIESELNRKLMPQLGRKANMFFCRFDLTERLRGDYATQMKGIALGRQWGLMSANEGRHILGMNPVADEAMDVYIYPTNMANAGQLPAQAETDNIFEQPLKALAAGSGKEPEDAENNQEHA